MTHDADVDAPDDDEFGQCPHEMIRLTCGRGGCSCPCDPCAPYRPIPPGKTDGSAA